MDETKHKKEVREEYAKIARKGSFLPSTTSCCCEPDSAKQTSKKIGYSEEELRSIPEKSNIGLGCGNPVALASLKEGEVVVDLGSGAGIDCFLAAKKVGNKGKIIGVDMTPEMIDKARENAKKGNYANVEFRLGEIENLPIADNTADAVISNCVINLSPDKKRVFEEAFRVLKPGGRLMVSDIVLLKELPDYIRKRAHPASCARTAVLKDEYIRQIKEAGFQAIEMIEEQRECFDALANDPNAKIVAANAKTKTHELKRVSDLSKEDKEILKQILDSTMSASISARKPS